MSADLHKQSRHVRGASMAIVRPSFVNDVATSSARIGFEKKLTSMFRLELSATIARWLEAAVVSHRMREPALMSLLHGGRMLTQAEVGSLHPNRPAALERRVWSIDTEDLADLPVYAYASTSSDVRGVAGRADTLSSFQSAYGAVRLIFDPAVHLRSTITVGDSLYPLSANQVLPTPFLRPTYHSCPIDIDPDRIDSDLDHCRPNEVVEVQILGGVYIDDICEIHFDAEPARGSLLALDGHGFRRRSHPNAPIAFRKPPADP